MVTLIEAYEKVQRSLGEQALSAPMFRQLGAMYLEHIVSQAIPNDVAVRLYLDKLVNAIKVAVLFWRTSVSTNKEVEFRADARDVMQYGLRILMPEDLGMTEWLFSASDDNLVSNTKNWYEFKYTAPDETVYLIVGVQKLDPDANVLAVRVDDPDPQPVTDLRGIDASPAKFVPLLVPVIIPPRQRFSIKFKLPQPGDYRVRIVGFTISTGDKITDLI